MASIRLGFVPPDDENISKLHIYEASDPSGPWVEIEVVTAIGQYPDYISEYTTNLALNLQDYFYIEWEDAKGARSDASIVIQGGTTTVVSEITDRVTERDSSLKEAVIVQEAESAIEYAFPGIDPYNVQFQPTYIEKRGLTNLTLAMCYLTELARGKGTSWTAGIVSLKQSDVALKMREKAIDRLVVQANRDLGLNFSMIAFLEDLDIAGGTAMAVVDQSRLLVELR